MFVECKMKPCRNLHGLRVDNAANLYRSAGNFGHNVVTWWSQHRSWHVVKPRNFLKNMARPTGFEPVTPAFGGQYSIQLSYGRVVWVGDCNG